MEASSPLLGDVLALSDPGVFEIIAELVPEHKDVTGDHVLLPGLWLEPKVAHHVLETVGENKADAQMLLSRPINTYK